MSSCAANPPGLRLRVYVCIYRYIADYRYRRFVGRVDYVSLDGATPQGCKRLLVACRSGVVASIDADTGDIGN